MKNGTSVSGPMGPVSVSSFDDRPSVTEVSMPTRGKPYLKDGQPLFPDGAIKISAMTVAEEKIIAQKNADSARKVSILLGRVCDFKGMQPEMLTLADQFFLLMKVRSLSYGNRYGFQFKCESCDNQFRHVVNLETDLDVSEVDDDWQEPFEVHLPHSGKVVKYRLLRSSDEIELNTRKIRKGNEVSDSTYVSLMARCLLSVDEIEFTSQIVREGWLEKQTVYDRTVLSEDIKNNTPGYSGDLTIVCPSCGFIHEGSLPLGSDFFRADVSR